MQRRLMVLGLSSLGRADGRVLASLDAVMVALASLAAPDVPAGEPAFPSPLLSRGEAAPGKYGSSVGTSTWSASGAYYGDSRGRGSRWPVLHHASCATGPGDLPASSSRRWFSVVVCSQVLTANTRLLAWSLMRSPNIRIMPSIQA